MKSSLRQTLGLAFSAALLVSLVSATTASAQQGGSSRWTAWLGCWSPSPAGLSQVEIETLPTVCVSPTANSNAVELSTIAGGRVVMRDTIDASGAAGVIKTPDCTGTKTARWSGDERRIYVSSAFTCGGAVTQVSSILAMTETGEWLDVRGVSSGGAENVRVARYRSVDFPAAVRAEMPAALRVDLFGAQGARIAAGAPIGAAAVTEAVRMTDSSVTETWVLERAQEFRLDAVALVQLADAGLPGNVTDAMVAVSNPGEFQIAKVGPITSREDQVTGRRMTIVAEPVCRNAYGSYYYPYSYGVSAYEYDRYGCGSYGYNNYGYRGYNSYGYGGYGYPAVIVTNGTVLSGTTTGASPQAVKGRGYTQNAPASTQSGRSSSPSSSGSSSTSSSGASTSTSTQSQPAQTEQRTAHPKP